MVEGMISDRAAAYAAKKYGESLPLFGGCREEIASFISGLSGDERILTEFLYGTMPVCDAADCAPAMLHGYVKHALFLRREVSWTRELPEDIFFNYVLYHRVNNEDITDCRPWFYEMLWPLVEGAGCEEAVKRVNYWCAQQAAYTASDGRTLGPVGVYNSGSGRCGEESTFLVTALRSIGIAARQVYTPRWAHCDDNHAWVEARVDGSWRFLGACEPEEVLNKGWFTNASSRAMMVHTRVFSDYQSGEEKEREEITERDGAALFYNDTAFYAKTARLTVSVQDEAGRPVSGARVSFELLNGAEYFPISVLYTDEEGETSLVTGLGSIHILVSKGTLCAEHIFSGAERCRKDVSPSAGDESGRETAKDREQPREGGIPDLRIGMTLSQEHWQQTKEALKSGWQEADLIAPPDYPMHPVKLTKEQKEKGRAGRQQAEVCRKQKLEAFGAPEMYEAYPLTAAAAKEDPGLQEILTLSYGNVPEVCRFLERHPGEEAVSLLGALAKKDYRDIRADVLEDHFVYGKPAYEEACRRFLQSDPACGGDAHRDGTLCRAEEILRYVWNPRIRTETITPYRSFLLDALTKEQKDAFVRDPETIRRWISETVSCEESRTYHPVVTSPAGVIRTGQGSVLSEKTLFVAVCRTLGIPARIDPVTLRAQYYDGNRFVAVGDEQSGAPAENNGAAAGDNVRLVVKSREEPDYFVAWTIGRLETTEDEEKNRYTGFKTMGFWGRRFADGKLTLSLPEGIYRLITTVRLPNGSQMAAVRILDTAEFQPGADGTPEGEVELFLRRPAVGQMIGSLQLEDFVLRTEDGKETAAKEFLDGHTMLAFLEEGAEPTEHFLNELREQEQEFGASGLKLIFVVSGQEALSNATLADTLKRLPAEVYYDDFSELPEVLARRMYTDPEKLPLVLLVSPGLIGRYASSGYNVGSVDMMLRIAKLLPA